MRAKAKMLDRLPGILRTPQKQSISTSRRLHRQLIDRHAFSPGLLDSRTSGSGEAEGSNVEFRDSKETIVICDGADYDDGLVGVGWLLRIGTSCVDDAGERHWGPIDLGHEKAAEHDFVEVGVGAACGRN
jgi:hypothetical protein